MASEKNDLVPSALAVLPTLANDQRRHSIDNEHEHEHEGDSASKHESNDHSKEHDHEPVLPKSEAAIPLKYRLMALAMVLFISTGTAFAEVTMGPLKSTLQRELKLNSESLYCLHSSNTGSRIDVGYMMKANMDRHTIRNHQYR